MFTATVCWLTNDSVPDQYSYGDGNGNGNGHYKIIAADKH